MTKSNKSISLEDTGYVWFSALDHILIDSRIKDFLREHNLQRIKLTLRVLND